MSNKVFVSEKQALVPFYGSAVLVARLHDERMVAIINSLCKMLKLAKHGQIERIRRNKDLAEHLLFVIVETSRGPQLVDALLIEAIPAWVEGIQLNQIAEDKRPLVSALKEHAHEALSRALLKPESEQVAEPMPETQAAPADPTAGGRAGAAPDSAWDRLFEALADIRREEQAKAGRLVMLEEWVKALDGRMAGMGQGGAANRAGCRC